MTEFPHSLHELEPIRRLRSKRNSVWLARSSKAGLVVVKHYQEPTRAAVEASNLAELAGCGVPVPRVLAQDEHSLVLEWLDGETLAEVMDRDLSGSFHWMAALARWLIGLHSIAHPVTGIRLKGDANLSNFVCCAGGIRGLDFEDTVWGDRVLDVGRLSAFILGHHPSFTEEKYRLAADFARCYNSLCPIASRAVATATVKELKEMAGRRPAESREIAGAIDRLRTEHTWPW